MGLLPLLQRCGRPQRGQDQAERRRRQLPQIAPCAGMNRLKGSVHCFFYVEHMLNPAISNVSP